jgi:hypothetical protein
MRRPTFFYTFDGLRIEETPRPMPGEVDAYFEREFTLTGTPVDDLYFRAAAGDIEEKNGGFVVNGRTVLRFPGNTPILRGAGPQKELLVPVKFTGNTAKITEDIIW